MERGYRAEEKHQREAQYWWAFACLVLAGRRGAADFHAELLRRSAGSYPNTQQVHGVLDEAIGHLAEVLNTALAERQGQTLTVSGWQRHLLALSTTPEGQVTEE
jgi:hypothetical protein